MFLVEVFLKAKKYIFVMYMLQLANHFRWFPLTSIIIATRGLRGVLLVANKFKVYLYMSYIIEWDLASHGLDFWSNMGHLCPQNV